MSNLDGLSFYGDFTLEDYIEYNMITFLKYGLLELGAFYNISLTHNESRLKPAFINGRNNYQYWQGAKHDWIWETGVSLKYGSGTSPTAISGLYFNTNFYPTGSSVLGTGWSVDYAHGMVIFDHPVPSGSIVKIEHALRAVQIYPSEDTEYRKLTVDWLAKSGGSGVYSIEEQAYLPAIFVGVDGYKTIKGLELGSRNKTIEAELQFDVLAPTPYEQGKLTDILYMMETKSFPLYNINTAPFPLTSSGTIASGALTWPNLITNYRTGLGRFMEDARIRKFKKHPIPVHFARVRLGLQLDVVPF